ncbi:hypothetical protein A5642_27340 [Mycolicibacterium mucogenicum]|uniref:DUF2029 domain-containing protein n=1 Tax=Mycolicibacterium mucogenicum TaxID=56689 RepID=A0A1A0MA86_MYCMU|nr:hypothetical protein A5642_27340 [Mycolicibacterium mucogenicum]
MAFAGFLLVSNSALGAPPTHDSIDYREIASAAPHLPHGHIGSAYTGRFVVHYTVGLFSWATGLPLGAAYAVALAGVLVVLGAVILALLQSCSLGEFSIAAGLLALSPYALRPYLIQTSMLGDLVFVIGLGASLYGVRSRRVPQVLAGLVVAVLGRQSAIGVAPVLALWVLLDPAWRSSVSIRVRVTIAAVAVVLTTALYSGVRAFTARFTIPYEPSLLHDSVLKRIADLPAAASELITHAARTMAPLIVPVALIIVLVISLGWRRVTFRCWGSLVVAASLVVQPLMIDPAWTGFAHNEQRLAALALLPLSCAAADLLGLAHRSDMPRSRILITVGLLAIGSLHHEFSVVGPTSLGTFLAIQFVVAVAACWLVLQTKPTATPAQP